MKNRVKLCGALLLLFFLGSTVFSENGAADADFSANPEVAPLEDQEEVPKLPGEEDPAADEVQPGADPTAAQLERGEDEARVYVIPIRGPIAKPVLYILRRGVKEAMTNEADMVLIDMDTPGGELGTTLEIMEILSRFDGLTAVYINTEAISAGAFISAATHEIFFAPQGIIGAAAPVLGTGEDVAETMRQKIVSYLRARIRAISGDDPYRGKVVSAMIDANYVLEIEGEILKDAGELLTLTASEAIEQYGDPPRPLLAAGVYESMTALLDSKYGEGAYARVDFEITWSESLATYLNAISPVLLGLGMLCIFIEFKTPGFGFIGAAGLAMMAVVFFGHYVAGLAGLEPVLLFFLGLAFIAVEIFLLPGFIISALIGVILVVTALLWGMADTWPGEGFAIDPTVLVDPIINLFLAVIVAIVASIFLARFLPRAWIWDKLVLSAALEGNSQGITIADVEAAGMGPDGGLNPGTLAIATTDLYPTGEIEVDGKRYQARIEIGSAEKGEEVEVVRKVDFGLLVRRIPR